MYLKMSEEFIGRKMEGRRSGMFRLSFPTETNLKRRKLQSDIKIHGFLQLHNFKRPRNENELLVDPWVENNLVYRIQYN